ISAWVLAGGQVIRPGGDATWGLADAHLPLVSFGWPADQVRVETLLWQDSGSAQWQVRLRNSGPARDVSLWVAVRAYQVQPGVAPIFSIVTSGSTVVANGHPVLAAGDAPSRVVASTGALGDVSVPSGAAHASGAQAAEDGAGLASLALVYDLHLDASAERTLSFAAPIGVGSPTVLRDPSPTEARWRELLRPDSIQLPDRRVTDAYYASLAYILMSNDGGALHPGPLLHDAFWYRDSAYMLAALERGGLLGHARDLLPALDRFQAPDGELPANVSTHRQIGHRRGAPEWDSQGEGIHALVEYFRFSGDATWLRGQWRAIDRAAAWLESLVQPDGLLPPGLSAEDLGPGPGQPYQRHFWDDFWGVIGLRDAAFAAGQLGNADRQDQLNAESSKLLQATMAAGQPGLAREGIFPNGPTSTETPADARSTSPAEWPGQLLEPDFARAQFQAYFDRFVKPYGGAFRHENNNFWPFGGLEIAHGSLFAGLPDQTNAILDWQLDHPTARGVWAWGDEVSQDGGELRGGDMPHGWTAAEYVALVRDMLLYESGDSLQLAAGIRATWLADSQTVAVDRLPSWFGEVSYSLRRAGTMVTLDIHAAKPPSAGYDLHLPFAAVSLDGQPTSGTLVHLPPTTTHATIIIAA
ncbi:MAG TPA: hypothetical protein VF157_16590, partial [Chloroflexota bacterium]